MAATRSGPPVHVGDQLPGRRYARRCTPFTVPMAQPSVQGQTTRSRTVLQGHPESWPGASLLRMLTADGEALRPILEPLRTWADWRASKWTAHPEDRDRIVAALVEARLPWHTASNDSLRSLAGR